MLRALTSFAAGALPLALVLGLAARARPVRLSAPQLATLAVLGALLGALGFYIERAGLAVMGLTLSVETTSAARALVAMFLFAAPLQEALKIPPIWPLYARHRITSGAAGSIFAGVAAAGYGAADASLYVWYAHTALGVLRALLGFSAHVFFAGIWGYALGAGARAGGRFFSVAWLSALLLHALFDHIVYGRPPAFMVSVIPLVIAMGIASWGAMRDFAPASSPAPHSEGQRRLLDEAPSLRDMRQALRRPNRPLLIHWIAIQALVTLGMMIVLFAGAVYASHRLGLDLDVPERAGVRSGGPWLFLGGLPFAAFPLSAYLVARASSARSVFEPAVGAALAIALLLLLVFITAPQALVFAVAAAPAAFALAFGGAWFGRSR